MTIRRDSVIKSNIPMDVQDALTSFALEHNNWYLQLATDPRVPCSSCGSTDNNWPEFCSNCLNTGYDIWPWRVKTRSFLSSSAVNNDNLLHGTAFEGDPVFYFVASAMRPVPVAIGDLVLDVNWNVGQDSSRIAMAGIPDTLIALYRVSAVQPLRGSHQRPAFFVARVDQITTYNSVAVIDAVKVMELYTDWPSEVLD